MIIETEQFDVDKHQQYAAIGNCYSVVSILTPNPNIFGYFETPIIIKKHRGSQTGSDLLYHNKDFDRKTFSNLFYEGKLTTLFYTEEDKDFFIKKYFAVLL